MKSKYGFIAILLMLMLAFSNSNYLYAQAAGDSVDPPEAVPGDFPILPSDDELESLLREAPNPGAVVRPLIQTKWNQRAPYNDLFPFIPGHAKDDGTGRLLTNCTNTAWAQIMAFHRHPARGSGQSRTVGPNHFVTVSSVNFNVAYDWNNMLNSYRRDGGNSNERQRNAVAVLMYHVALAVGAQGNYYTAMLETFGYDRSIQQHERIFYTDAGWEALIRSQLDAGLPVYYSSSREDGGGHAFIVDGYDNQGRFHVNWGWGGGYDGWYSLNALAPRPERNYDRAQSVVINIKPNAGSTGSNEFALTEFTAIRSTGRRSIANINLRSLGFFPGGQAGMAVVDNNDNIVSVIASRNIGDNLVGHTLRPGSEVVMEMTCVVPETVRQGQYRLMAVTRIGGGQWKIVTLSRVSRIPNAFILTVTESGAEISRMAVQQTLTLNVPASVAIDRGLSVQLNFTAPSAGEYTFESSNSGSLRPAVFTNASSTTPIRSDGSGTNFRFTRNLRAGEVFTFFTGIVYGNGSGSYTVNVRAVQLGSLSFTADAPAVVNINNGLRVQMNFTAPSAGDYRFESSNNGTLDPTAYSASTGTGSAVVISQDDGSGRNFLFARNLNTGEVFTFFAGVRSGTGSGSYTVTVQRVQSVMLALNTPAAVTINNGQRAQISFTASSAGVYTFESSDNGTLDPVAYSAMSGSREINDDGGQGNNFLFTRNLRAGETFTFFAGVIWDRGNGSYTVNVQGSR